MSIDQTPAPGTWTGDPRPEMRRAVRRAIGASAISLVVIAILASLFRDPLLAVLIAAPIAPILVLALPRWANRRDLALLEDPDDHEIGLVQVTIWKGLRRVGMDRGVIWFEDDLFHFRGHSCYFALAAGDYTVSPTAVETPTRAIIRSGSTVVQLKLLGSYFDRNEATKMLLGRLHTFEPTRRELTEPRILPPSEPKS